MTTTWKKKNVLVTGGDGFIVGWLAKTLIEKGARVLVLVRDVREVSALKVLDIEAQVTQVFGDLVDNEFLTRVLNEYSVDTVFHLAAQTLVQTAHRSPVSTFESNIKGTWQLMEACRQTKTIQRIVVASSDKAYGVQAKLPYTEESPLLGLYPYDASKACADILSRSYAASYNLPVVVTRNANTYGGGDLNFSRIIPDAICSILEGREFEIRSDGTPVRDYLYVKDAVSAYLCLAEQMEREEVRGQAFNFGTEAPVSVVELFRLIAKLCKKPAVKPKILGTAKNEIDRQYLSSKKAIKTLGWRAGYTLEEGLIETIEWYKDYLVKKSK